VPKSFTLKNTKTQAHLTAISGDLGLNPGVFPESCLPGGARDYLRPPVAHNGLCTNMLLLPPVVCMLYNLRSSLWRCSMWEFYRSVFRSAVKEFWTATDNVLGGAAVLSFLLVVFNRKYGEHIVNAWNGISPWWSIIPIGLLVIYRLLRANYELVAQTQRERDDAISKFSTMPEFRPLVVPVEFAKAEKHSSSGLYLRNPGYDALDIQVPSVPVGNSTYMLVFPERLAQMGERTGISFIEAWLEDKTQTLPELGGGDLHGIMAMADVGKVEFSILYKDTDFRDYRTNCVVERTTRSRNGLEVRAVSQEILPHVSG
jgi:hypothetical protein